MLHSRCPKSRQTYRNRGRLAARIGSIVLYTILFLVFTPLTLAIIYRFLPVPVTPLMLIRLAEGHAIHKTWVPLNQISPALRQSAVAAEDNLFCLHDGFDWKAMNKAFARWQAAQDAEAAGKEYNKPIKGGSTISQQIAKNVFLIPNRSILRKVAEVPLTYLIEKLWPKQRILEVYLNIAEWGPGIYGAEAAAQHYFKTSARKLTRQQAAQLAAILPAPLKWSAARPGPYVASRSRSIIRRSFQLGPTYLRCTVPLK